MHFKALAFGGLPIPRLLWRTFVWYCLQCETSRSLGRDPRFSRWKHRQRSNYRNYEFQLDSSLRAQAYRFRAETQEQLDMWVTGLNTLKNRPRSLEPPPGSR
jgi:hypothetical protein